MSGISGIISFKKNLYAYKSYNRLLVRDMATALTHRGPDGADEWVGEHAAFANTCLLTPDTANAKQPVKRTVEGYEFVITYDGELYNAHHLRNDLIGRGYIFETDSDTEVLLYGYIHYGEDFCKMLDGVYAFAIWDSMRQQVYICRDRLGAKPFFYAKCGETFVFASEIKALFRYPYLKPRITKDGLCEIFGMSPLKTPSSGIFEDICELPSGHFLVINRNTVTTKKYWDCLYKEHTDSFEETKEHVKELLHSSIKKRFSTDTAVILSDDISSDIIVSLCPTETKTENICTYSVNADTYLKHMCDILNFSDFPLPSAFLYFYSKINKKHSAVLSGLGCNEVFYITHHCSDSIFPWLYMREYVLKPAVKETLDLKSYTQARHEELCPNSVCVNLFLPALLSKADTLSTASGVTVRTPFCDHTLVEYVLNIPDEMKESVLIETVRKILHRDDISKKKSPHPITHNTDYEKKVYELLLNILNDYSSPILTFIDRASVFELCTPRTLCKMTGFIEYLIQVNCWLKKFNPRIV